MCTGPGNMQHPYSDIACLPSCETIPETKAVVVLMFRDTVQPTNAFLLRLLFLWSLGLPHLTNAYNFPTSHMYFFYFFFIFLKERVDLVRELMKSGLAHDSINLDLIKNWLINDESIMSTI